MFAAVNLIASMVEMLELEGFQGVGASRKQIDLPPALDSLTINGLSDMLWQFIYCWGLRGNIVAKVLEREGRQGHPTLIDIQHPDDVKLYENHEDAKVTWYLRGHEFKADQVWHSRVFPTPGRTMGLSPIGLHAVTIGQGIAAQNFGAQWFIDGAHPSALLTNDSLPEVDQKDASKMKRRFVEAVRGTREPVVLGKGWKYQQIQIAPAESQFLETQKYTSAEAARIYGPGMPEILGYETTTGLTYSNISQRSVDLLTFTLNPWLTRVERLLSSILPRGTAVVFNRKQLLQTDALTRFQVAQLALKNAVLTINEVRAEDGLTMVPWGDEPFLPAMSPAAAGQAEAGAVAQGDIAPGDIPSSAAPVPAKGTP